MFKLKNIFKRTSIWKPIWERMNKMPGRSYFLVGVIFVLVVIAAITLTLGPREIKDGLTQTAYEITCRNASCHTPSEIGKTYEDFHYCSCTFLYPYFGDYTWAAQIVEYQESNTPGIGCDPNHENINSDGSYDWGLFQINSQHCGKTFSGTTASGENFTVTIPANWDQCKNELFKPEFNAKVAVAMSGTGTSWCPTWCAGYACDQKIGGICNPVPKPTCVSPIICSCSPDGQCCPDEKCAEIYGEINTCYPGGRFSMCFYDQYNNRITCDDNSDLGSNDAPFISIGGEYGTLIDWDWNGGIIRDNRGAEEWNTNKYDLVSGVWRGRISVDESADYTFRINSDNGFQLWIDGYPIIQQWTPATITLTNYEKTTYITQGWHNFKIIWFEDYGWAKLRVDWRKSCTTTPPSNKFRACYFKGTNFNTYLGSISEGAVTSPAPATATPINHNWGSGVIFGGEYDTVSGIWQGKINFSAGYYKFKVSTDDGMRLYVNGVLRLDKWYDQHASYETSWLYLSGSTTIKLEWYEKYYDAMIILGWEKQVTAPDLVPDPLLKGTPGSGSPYPVQIYSYVRNNGNVSTGSGFYVRWTVNYGTTGCDPTSPISCTFYNSALVAGGSNRSHLEFTPTASTYTVCFTVDSNSNIAESNEGNNQTCKSFTYTAPASVKLYEHTSYYGGVKELSSDHDNFNSLTFSNGVNVNDRVSSIKIPSGWIATLFEHTVKGGRAVSLTGNVSNFNSITLNFNDLPSSLTVPSGCSVKVWQHTYKAGGYKTFYAGSYSNLGSYTFNNGVNVNNNISTAETSPSSCYVRFYDYTSYSLSGKVISLAGYVPDFNVITLSFNDIASSIKIVK